ncbi:LysR family transcriptional regulator [Halomonas sp. G15]|uniref:LysR family transcriptional regulator n=1 Tax=Halomonas sp. G15 TaxID=2903521 RepID=UPI001E4BE511|nr:LysR family transcriptional regulator [Halomonas sp. G15]MCE0733542.1 LysR family transcriptional regulator [Halomonas sp. G15]
MHDFDELAAFDAIMASGSLTSSARKLGLAKSTLSRRISQLESRLGQPLLRRQANRLIPTEAGLLFHDYCREMLRLASRSREALADLSEAVRGRLTLGVHCGLARSWAAGVAEDFLARHPEVELTLQAREQAECSPESQCVQVWLGEVPTEAGLRAEPLGRLSRHLYASPDYLARHGAPAHPEALAHHPWIDLLGTTHAGLTLHHSEQGAFCFRPPRSRLRVDLPVLHVDAIARGQGIGVLPEWIVAAREAHHPGELVACLPAWRPMPLAVTLLYPYGQRPRRVDALLDCLRRAVPEAWRP